MPSHYEHPSKAGLWQDGTMAVHPDADLADTTVWFAFDRDGDDARWEGVLATSRADGTATLAGVPYFLHGVTFGDVVTTVASAEGALVATGVVEKSGMFTFRVILNSDDPTDWQRLVADVGVHGCYFDVRDPKFVALAVPQATAQSVADYLQTGENAGHLNYDTGQ
jgi:hypothetical protein